MPEFVEARAKALSVLQRELVGPDPQGSPFDPENDVIEEKGAWLPRYQSSNGEEILTRDSPDRRYGIGVIYSKGGRAPAQQEVATGDGPPEDAVIDPDAELTTRQFRDHAESIRSDLGDESPSHDLDLTGANEFRPTTMAVTFLVELPAQATVRLKLNAGRYHQHDIAVGARTRTWWFRRTLLVGGPMGR